MGYNKCKMIDADCILFVMYSIYIIIHAVFSEQDSVQDKVGLELDHVVWN